jgi:hypothetical protein
MAVEPTTDVFDNMQIYLGDGESPEGFDAPCGFSSKSLTLSASTSTAIVVPCPDDGDSPGNTDAPWEHAGVTANSATLQANGVMAEESYATWAARFTAGDAFNIRCAKRLGYWEGPAIITSLGETAAFGQEGNLIQLAVGLRNAGKWTWVPAA